MCFSNPIFRTIHPDDAPEHVALRILLGVKKAGFFQKNDTKYEKMRFFVFFILTARFYGLYFGKS